jgi:hypothetical protein
MTEETKYCPKCDKELPVQTHFTRRKNGRISSYCRPCLSLYCRQHYVNNSAAHNARRKEARKQYRIRNRAYVVEYLRTHPCVDCGEADPLILEFDHLDPKDKKYVMSDLSRTGCPLALLQREMAKCAIRCIHCHRRRTARQFGWAKRISLLPGCSSGGRALLLGSRGRRFDPSHSDQIRACGLTG